MIHVNFEIAKRLKEAGYDAPCEPYYFPSGDLITGGDIKNYNTTHTLVSAPTLNEVCDWLREAHEIHCYTVMEVEDEGICHYHPVVQRVNGGQYEEMGAWSGECDHASALTASITRALDIVNDKKEGK